MRYIILSLVALLVMPLSASALSPVEPSRLPVVRLYNAALNDHFYTTSYVEAYQAQDYGYKIESQLGFVARSQTTGTVGIIRMWNPGIKKHFYTTSETEAAAAAGYIREGVIGYLLKDLAPESGSDDKSFAPELAEFAVYRMYNSAQRKHFYTVNRQEMQNVLNMGYRLEGDLGKLFEDSSLIQVCPDEWIVNRMPGTVGDSTPKEYFIIDGVREELSFYDIEWINSNCNVERQEVY